MNASIDIFRIRQLLVRAGLFLAIASVGLAQNASAPDQGKKQEPEGGGMLIPDARAVAIDAKGKAKAGNLDAAEQSITSLNLAARNTAEWHLEAAQRLVQLAEQVSRDGTPANVAALARKALDQLTRAEQLATSATARANAKMLAGFIHERLLASSSQAVANYRAAAQLAPDSPRAKEALERTERTDSTFRNKAKAPGK